MKLILGENFFPIEPCVDSQGRMTYGANFTFTAADLMAPLPPRPAPRPVRDLLAAIERDITHHITRVPPESNP